MKEFYFVRHGRTLFNAQDKVQGWCDSPLTRDGIETAQRLGKALENIHFDGAFSSTSERAYDTAAYILAGRNINIIRDRRLKEFNFGTLEGDHEESKILFKNRSRDRAVLLKEGWVDVGGENIAMVNARVDSFFKMLESQPDGRYLIVSHGMWIAAALAYLDPDCFDQVNHGIKNCSVSIVIEEDDNYHTKVVNQICLLEGEG